MGKSQQQACDAAFQIGENNGYVETARFCIKKLDAWLKKHGTKREIERTDTLIEWLFREKVEGFPLLKDQKRINTKSKTKRSK